MMEVDGKSNVKPSLGFHDVDFWATTCPDPNPPTIKFRWSIRNFMQIYNSCDKITSPSFEGQFEGKGGIGYKWQIRLRKQTGPRTGREFLSAHVYSASINPVNPFQPQSLSARFKICILDCDGNIFRNTGEDSLFHIFNERSGWGYNNFCLVDHFRTDGDRLLPGGDLLLTCEIQIETPHISVQGRGGVRNEVRNAQSKSMSRLAHDFRNLLHEGLGSDVVIYVVDSKQKTKFRVHKVVLAARSQVFRAMLTFSGKIEASITIKDFDHEVVAAMLEYMYTGMVDDKTVSDRAQDMLQIADFYNLEELRKHCEVIIAENLDVENAMDLLAFADKFSCIYLKKVTMNFISCHKKAVMNTSGFKRVKEAQPKLIVDLYLN